MTATVDQFNAPNSTFNTAGGDIVQTTTYIAHVENFSAAVSSASSQVSTPAFIDAPVDLLSAHFTGRNTELTQITQAFTRPRTNIPLRCVLFGDQGVGKSQLTYKWSKSTFAQGENTYVMWMSATTVEKLDQGFSKILHLIEHPHQFRSEQIVRLTAARRWLENVDSGNWLLVLDNVFPETLAFIREHLPRKNGRGSILFSTRTRNVAVALANAAGDQHPIVHVPMLNVKDGAELFYGHFSDGEIDVPSDTVEKIVKSVGCLPLAISHTAAYMKQSASTLENLLELYESEDKIDLIGWENTLSEYEHKSVTATFECQLEDLQQKCPDVSNLLKILAYLDTECIPLEMLITGAKTSSSLPNSLLALIRSPIKRQNAITQLQTRCLASYEPSSLSLRIHDLIQLVILEKTKNSGTHQEWFECAVELACNAFEQIKDCGSPASWPQCEVLIPHIQSLTIRQSTSSKAKSKLLVASSHYGWYLRSRGRYGEAEVLLVQVLADQEQLWGLEDERTLRTMYRLAVVYRERGRYVDAETLLKRVLQSQEKLLGSEHDRTLTTMYQLAYVYLSQLRYAESQELIENVLKAREKQLGSDHIWTLYTKDMLAVVYFRQKRYREAETLYKEVLESKEKQFGPDHIDTARTMNNLALLYLDQGHYSDAEEPLKRVLQIWEKQLGSNHPDTLLARNNLAEVYESQGRYNDAEELFVYVLERREEMIGLSHPYTRRTAQQLASVYEELGRYDDAARVRHRADEPR